MTRDQLKWALLVISGAPIQSTEEARIKAFWLAHFADALQPAPIPQNETAEPSE